jgi:dipeptidyl-peptidase-4
VRSFVALLAVVLGTLVASAQPPQTVAESTDYKATSRYADVVAFCKAVADRGPTARLEYFGTSHEGRKLPLLVIADPPVASAEEAKKAGRLVVMAFANIHAGEVDGKEALLALARDLTEKKGHPLLKDLVILLVPILNADGNEKFATTNRPGQNGPPETGTRANAQGLDLNRDFVKLESPEVRALVELFNAWDPALVIDCHTTNGSKHRYALTYDGPRYPSTDTPPAEWANAALFPEVTRKVKAATGFDIAPYGNFSRDRTKWETYPATPRFGVQYFSLRGKVGVLSESYSYASFKDRVKVTHGFVTACFEVAAAKREDLEKVIAQPVAKRVALRTKTESFPESISVRGFEEVEKNGKRVATEKPKEYVLDFVARVVPTETAQQPYAYLVPAQYPAAVELLQRHGVKVEELREDIVLDVEAFDLTAVDTREGGFPKRFTTTDVDGRWSARSQRVPAGTLVVKTHGTESLAATLLEPRGEDGLTTWNFFRDGLRVGAEFPVLRLPKSHPLTLGEPEPLLEDRVTGRPITDALLFSRTGALSFGLQGSPVTPGAWVDGNRFLQTKEGKLWIADARTGKAEPFADPELIKKSLAAIKEFDVKTADGISKGTSFRFNPDRSGFLFNMSADLAVGYFDGRPAVRLTKSEGTKEYVTFSPDGQRVAFVRGGNLFAVSVEKPEEKQLTHDGGGDILNGKGDWVYEEEIFLRNGRAYWWSPDGKRIAFMRFDDGPVRRFNIVDLGTPRGQLETYPYPKVGDPNPLVTVGVVAADGGKPDFLDMGAYKPEDTVVSRVGWLPDSKTVFAYVQNRTQTWLDVATWPEADSKPRVLFREKTEAWVDDLGEPRFLPDGSFLILSERSGWKHLYHYAADGKLLAQVTDGEWEVKEVLRVDAKEMQVYFTASMTSPTGTDLCRVTIGGKAELVSEKGKTHRVSLAPSGGLYIDRAGDPRTPTTVAVCEAGNGEVRKLDTNPARERNRFKFGRYERVKIPTSDGFVLEGSITYPPDFDEMRKYPVWLFTYAGPHAPTIRDEFASGRVLDQSLATSGIIVFRVDPRSASGKGAKSAWTCYKQLGVQELKDLEEAVAWLCKNPYADAKRVGISGHSYGGFMAAYALTHSKTFSAGIASGPVTDWKLYDTIYTERYMLTPKENPEGYRKSSCVEAAKNLHGRLLIVHGMLDDNVHVQNSVQLADALQKAGKEFEMMFYPQSRHGIGGQHYMKLQTDFIRRTMGVEKKN